jgi:hypothetical protein
VPKRDEVTGESRRLHNEELDDVYPTPTIISVIKSRTMRGAEHVACMIGKGDVYRVLEVRPEEIRPQEEKIKTEIQAMGWGVMGWIDRTQERDRWRAFVKAIMKLRVP